MPAWDAGRIGAEAGGQGGGQRAVRKRASSGHVTIAILSPEAALSLSKIRFVSPCPEHRPSDSELASPCSSRGPGLSSPVTSATVLDRQSLVVRIVGGTEGP